MESEAMDWQTWGPPLVVLGVGLVAGLVVALLQTRGRASTPTATSNEVLLAKKEQLFEAVRELDADREKLGDEVWAARREALVGKAADVLRELEAPAVVAVEAPVPPAAPARRARVVWGTVAIIFFAGLAGLLVNSAKPRQEGMSMTGGTANDQAGPPPEIAAALATLEKDPKNLDALNVLTWGAIRMRSLDGAMQYLQRAQEIAPDDAYVQTHLGILSLQVKMYDRANDAFAAALAAHPGLPRALIWKSVVAWQQGDTVAAEAAIQAVLSGAEATSEEREMAGEILAEMRKPPPQERLTGKVLLADGVTVPPGGILFVIARRTAAGGGPPLAASRKPGATFPASFSISDEDMMMGGQWPEQVWVQARLDADGNPTTKGEGDLESEVAGPLSSGAADLTLTLSAPH